jgi:hypothetical protein
MNRPLTSSLAARNAAAAAAYNSHSYTNKVLANNQTSTIFYKFSNSLGRGENAATNTTPSTKLLSVINIDADGKATTTSKAVGDSSSSYFLAGPMEKSLLAFTNNNNNNNNDSSQNQFAMPKLPRSETPDPKSTTLRNSVLGNSQTPPPPPRLSKASTTVFNSNSNNSLQIVKSTLQLNQTNTGIPNMSVSSPIRIKQLKSAVARSKENGGEAAFNSVSTYFDMVNNPSNHNFNSGSNNNLTSNSSSLKKKNTMYTTNYYFYNNLSTSPSSSSQNNNYAGLSAAAAAATAVKNDEKKKALIKNYLKRSMAKWSSTNSPNQLNQPPSHVSKPQSSGGSITGSKFANKSLMNFKDYGLTSAVEQPAKGVVKNASNTIYFNTANIG